MSLYPELVRDDMMEASAPPEEETEQVEEEQPGPTRLFQNQAILDGHFNAPAPSRADAPSAPSESEAFQNHVLKQTLQEHGEKLTGLDENKRLNFAQALGTESGTKNLLGQLQEKVDSPDFVATVERARTTICLENADENDQVGFVPTDDVEWWTVSLATRHSLAFFSDLMFVYSCLCFTFPQLVPKDGTTKVEDSALDGAYVFVENSDVVDAMAEFIALSLARIPETQSLSSARLQQMLSSTFGELREKGPIGKLWDWGAFLYTTYSWATCAVGIYREPAMAYFVMRAIWSAAKWVLGGRPN